MDRKLESFRPFLPASIILTTVGWGGLLLLVLYSLPYVWSRWSFFVLGFMALSGTALPVVYFLHRRFPGDPPAGADVVVRQTWWVGVYGATLAWLQLGRLVSLYVIFGLAGGLIALEYFIRMREKAGRRPATLDRSDDENPPA